MVSRATQPGGGMIVSLLLQIFFTQAHSQNLSDLPGFIPLAPIRQAASDLVYDGKILSPDEARALVANGKVKDLSLLDPDDSSILWKAQPATELESSVPIELDQPFEYLDNSPEAVGRFGFTLAQKDQNGVVRTYRVRLDTRNHNVLLRRNLLRKLGYNIPAIIHSDQIEISFKGNFSRDQFIDDIKRNTFLEAERWLLEKKDNAVVLQDVIIFSGAEDTYYNLARGDLTAAVIQNRRIFNALLVPYNLTDVGESVNVFSWNPGKVFNGQLSLPYEESYIFSTPLEDARWIGRRIMKLSRDDFQQIVHEAKYPIEVEKLLVEKLISRRNFLRKHLGFENEFSELAVDTRVSYGEKLVNGKLTHGDWPGYAQKFTYGDPESPISGDEINAFFSSKALSNFITNVVKEFNERFVPRSDLAYDIYDHQLDIAVRQFAEFLETGEVKKVPFGFWTTPTFNGNIIANREVVTGSYLGTDNMVQLADVIGFAVDAGVYIGADGLPSQVGFNGGVQGYVTRTYAHVKPINSIKLALKEPFRNMMVPNLKKNLAQTLNEVLSDEFSQLDSSAQQEKIASALKEFKDSLKVGESLIITTSLGAGISLNPSMSWTSRLAVVTRWARTQSILNRLHIFRRDDDTIQVFKDPAHIKNTSVSVGMEAYVPIITYKFNRKGGKAETRFYSLNINADQAENPQVTDTIRALSRLLLRSKVDVLHSQQRPYVINHEFKENSSEFSLLMGRWLSLKSEDRIAVTHPNGFTKNFLRRTTGKRSGVNYEELGIDILNSLVEEYTNEDILIQTNAGRDPADSLWGSSVSQLFSFEAEIKNDGTKTSLVDPYVNLSYRWRNWSLSKEKLLQIIFDINSRFNFEFFNERDVQPVEKIQLSTVEISVSIYEDGIKYLSGFTRNEVERILAAKAIFPNYLITPGDQPGTQVRRLRLEREERRNRVYVAIFGKMYENFQRAYIAGDVDRAIKYLSQVVTFGERLLPAEDFYTLFGDEKNLFVRSQIMGFREGDEREDRGLTSNSYGQIGSKKGNGPLRDIQNKIGISESEFFIYWLLNKI